MNRRSRFVRSLCGVASIAVIATGACSGSTPDARAAGTTPAQPDRQGRPVAHPARPVAAPAMRRTARDERAALSVLSQRIQRKDGPVRVLVHLDGVLPKRPPAPPNAGVGARRPIDAAELGRRGKAIGDAQDELLTRLGRKSDKRPIRYGQVPALSMQIDKSDIDKLTAWFDTSPEGSPDRPFGVYVEEIRKLKPQAAVRGMETLRIEDALAAMDMQSEPMVMSEPPIVVVIDDRVDETLEILNPAIEAIEWMSDSPPKPLVLRPAVRRTGESFTLGHGTQVACVLTRAAPRARIIALDAADTNGDIWTDEVLEALDRVASTWAPAMPQRIAAVSVSLGDPEFSTSLACDGGTEMSLAFATLVADLADMDIPVIVPAGNDGSVPGEVYFPACVSEAVSVGGTQIYVDESQSALRANSSNWGAMLDCAAVGATVSVRLQDGLEAFDIVGGTSIAVPFVAAAFANLRGANPRHSSATILSALQETGTPVVDGGTVREIRVHRALEKLNAMGRPAEASAPKPSDGPVPKEAVGSSRPGG
jgi:hypothetical protein